MNDLDWSEDSRSITQSCECAKPPADRSDDSKTGLSTGFSTVQLSLGFLQPVGMGFGLVLAIVLLVTVGVMCRKLLQTRFESVVDGTTDYGTSTRQQ